MFKQAFWLSILAFAMEAQAAQEYRVIDLGSKHVPSGMNNNGEVVGHSHGQHDFRFNYLDDLERNARAFKWDAARGWHALPQVGREMSAAYAIDDDGVIAGITAKPAPGYAWGIKRRAFVLKADGTLVRFPVSVHESVAVGLKNGLAVGAFYRTGWGCGPFSVAMLWDSSTGSTVQHRGPIERMFCSYSAGYAADDSLQVYGVSGYRNWTIWTGGGAWWSADQSDCSDGPYGSCRAPELTYDGTNLSGPASAVNRVGQAVGSSNDRAVLWWPALGRSAMPTDLGKVASWGATSPWAISDDGTVVGEDQGIAFRWRASEGMRDLNTLIGSSGRRWDLRRAVQVNAKGWILAVGAKDGQYRACLLVPV